MRDVSMQSRSVTLEISGSRNKRLQPAKCTRHPENTYNQLLNGHSVDYVMCCVCHKPCGTEVHFMLGA